MEIIYSVHVGGRDLDENEYPLDEIVEEANIVCQEIIEKDKEKEANKGCEYKTYIVSTGEDDYHNLAVEIMRTRNKEEQEKEDLRVKTLADQKNLKEVRQMLLENDEEYKEWVRLREKFKDIK